MGASDPDALERAKALFYDLTKLVDLKVSLSLEQADSGQDSNVACESAILNFRILRLSDVSTAEITTSECESDV